MTLERYKYQKKNVIVFKPKIDTRYSDDHIVSHLGWKIEAITVESGSEMLSSLQTLSVKPDVVAVDEMFMINGSGEVLIWLYRQLGMSIVVSTLDLSYTGKPFDEVTQILPWATLVEKCTAVCTVCGEDARYTHKKVTNDEEILVGGAEIYEPRCFSHHLMVNKRR